MSEPLTRAEYDWLEHVEWALRYFDGASSGRTHRRSVAERLAERGLLKSIGLVHQADGDGCVIETRQMREAWTFTDAGRAALADARKRLGPDFYPQRLCGCGEAPAVTDGLCEACDDAKDMFR